MIDDHELRVGLPHVTCDDAVGDLRLYDLPSSQPFTTHAHGMHCDMQACVCKWAHGNNHNATGVTHVSASLVCAPSLDERLLLLAREAAEAVEALALAVAVVETAVRALSELRERAQGRVRAADHLADGVGAARDAGVRGERAGSRAGRGVHLEEELHAGLARLVREGDVEVDLGAISGDGAGGLALVGRAMTVRRRDVLLAVHEAVAYGGTRRARASGDALEHLVGERAERVLHVRGHDGVVR